MTEAPLIVHVIHHLVMGGMENGLVNLINRIPADRYRHCVICVEDFSDFRNRIERPDVEVLALRRSELSTMQLYRRIHAILKARRPAIVHSRNLSGLDALLPALTAGVTIRVHGEHGWDVSDLHGDTIRSRLLRKLHRPLVNRYITVSKDLQNYLIRRIGVARSRISQIYNGVDTSRFVSAGATGKPPGRMPEDFYGDDKIVIGTVGRLQPVKDQATLVRAFGRMAREDTQFRKHARLVIVGDGPQRDALANCIKEEALADLAWLPGARDDAAPLYQCLDIFVLPSLNEGISNTLLEAMSSGLPVIATAVGGNAELVVDDTTGKLIRRSDPIQLAGELRTYAFDANLRMRQGAAGRRRALESFSIDAMVGGYLEVYDSFNSRVNRGSPKS